VSVHSKIGAKQTRPQLAHVLLFHPRVLHPSPQLLRDLARAEGHSLVSCYLEFSRAGKDVRQNAIRLKNCQRVLAAARDAGLVDEHTVTTATGELARAAEAAADPRAARGSGVAMFASGAECATVETATPFASSVTIAPRYYVVPLVPLAAAQPPGLILALSRHAVRLVDAITALDLPLPNGTPRSLTDAVGSERREPTLQQHSIGTGAVFHGHGEGEDDVLPEIAAYCRQVVASLGALIARSGATVVLAGDGKIAAVFRSAASGWRLLDEQIHGSHDRTPAAQLAAFAAPLLAARQDATNAELKSLYGARSAERRASDDLPDIVAAARAGRIDTLLLEQGAALAEPGLRTAREPLAVQPEGPFNSEVVLTLRSGGEVRVVPAVDMPTAAHQAAIFRF
jgi:hypothetical protein